MVSTPTMRIYVNQTVLEGRDRYEEGIYEVETGLGRYFIANGWAAPAEAKPETPIIRTPTPLPERKSFWRRLIEGG
jgi:hypothetical protein